MEQIPIEIIRIIFGFLKQIHRESLALTCKRMMGALVGAKFCPQTIDEFREYCLRAKCKVCGGSDDVFDRVCRVCIDPWRCEMCGSKVAREDTRRVVYWNNGMEYADCLHCITNYSHKFTCKGCETVYIPLQNTIIPSLTCVKCEGELVEILNKFFI
jgi:hypothetical protein